VPVAHPVKGHVPVAMVMRQADAAVTEAELKQYCLDNGPAYAHPRRIRLVEEMPLSGAAKIDRVRVQRELEAAFGSELAQAS
jgi:acyl-CoA synthetase (AMP-forming)/AMP-acid ligase II